MAEDPKLPITPRPADQQQDQQQRQGINHPSRDEDTQPNRVRKNDDAKETKNR